MRTRILTCVEDGIMRGHKSDPWSTVCRVLVKIFSLCQNIIIMVTPPTCPGGLSTGSCRHQSGSHATLSLMMEIIIKHVLHHYYLASSLTSWPRCSRRSTWQSWEGRAGAVCRLKTGQTVKTLQTSLADHWTWHWPIFVQIAPVEDEKSARLLNFLTPLTQRPDL